MPLRPLPQLSAGLLAPGLLATLLLASSLFGLRPAPRSQEPAPPVPAGVPPDAWASVDAGAALDQHEDRVVAEVDLDTNGRNVTLWWTYDPFGNGTAGPHAWARQSFAERYCPTAVVALDRTRLVVAGKEPAPWSRTVIELWTFADAEAAHATDPDTDAITWTFEPGQRTAVELVHAGAAPRRDVVRHLFEHQGVADSVLVLFHDSSELCALDLASGRLELVAAAEGGHPGALVVPELAEADRVDARGGADHRERGYVYFLGHGSPLPGGSKTLLLYDADRDGRLDGHELLDGAAWVACGYHDRASYR